MYEATNSMSNDLQSRFNFSETDADRIARLSLMTGSGEAALGTPGAGLLGSNAKLAGRLAAQMSRETGRTISAEEAWSEVQGYVERQTSSASARQVRDDFMRETSTSQDAETRGLSQRLGASIAESRSASLEASSMEENWERVSHDVSNAERRGFSLDHNETQEFVRFAEGELSKPENSVLKDIGWRPGMVTPQNAQQEGVRDIMLERFMDSRIDSMRDELGLVPDGPMERNISGPSITSPEGIRNWDDANQAQLGGRAPSVNVRANSRDTQLADDVAGRVEYGEERILEGGRGIREEGVPAYRGSSQLRGNVDERNHETLGETLGGMVGNGASQLLDKVDDFLPGSFGGGPSGNARLVELPRGVTPVYPVSGAVSSGPGMRSHPITGARREHRGVDIPAPAGTPILAPADGTISTVSFQENGAGNYVVVDHADGSQSKYFHMQSRSPLEQGQPVSRGDQIGRVGSTGSSTGPHLHYEIWKDGKPVDPRRHGFE